MAHNFRLVGIAHEPFEALFALSDEALGERSAQRCYAHEHPGYPCRISLEDAQVGEELLLLPYAHLSAASPYQASGPIFVRRGARQRRLAVGEVPDYVSSRLMSLRAYDAAHRMVAAEVCPGTAVAEQIEAWFGREDVAYVHLHNARRGCFSCVAERA